MIQLHLAADTEQPVYLQLYKQVRDQIRSGTIVSGTRLPSVRTLQQQFNMSKTPIETAYQMLIAEGYAVSKPRSGLYVMNMTSAPAAELVSGQGYHEFRLSAGTVPQAQSNFSIDFRVSTTDMQAFPLRIWKKMLHDALEASADEICRYGDFQGEYPFRAILADYLRTSRGVSCLPEQIIVGSGIRYSTSILAKLFAGKTTVAFEDPGYSPVQEQFRQSGFRILGIPVTEKGLSIEELCQTEAEAVYVTPSHQFPTGCVMPYSEREQLLQWASDHDAYIIEDDYDSEFRYLGKPIPSLQSLDRTGRVIYIGTFSKVFTPALRMNYMVLPMELLRRMKQGDIQLDAPSRVDQWAMQAFMAQGHWFRHIRRMRSTYRKKHHRLLELLEEHFGKRIQITGQSAGLHVQLTVRTDCSSDELVQLAAAHHIGVYDLPRMYATSNRPLPRDPYIYLGFGGHTVEEIEQGVALLREAWRPALDGSI